MTRQNEWATSSSFTDHWLHSHTLHIVNALIGRINCICKVPKTGRKELVCKAFLKLMQIKLKTEYKIAEKKGKLSKHFKKFTFNFDENWFIN